MAINNSALMQEFLLESHEGLNSLNEALTRLEKTPKDKELLNSVYRTVHTMKGGSRFLKLPRLEELAHSLENLLDLVRDDSVSYSSVIADVLLKGVDLILVQLKNLETSNSEVDMDLTDIKARILAATEPVSDIQALKGDAPIHSEVAEVATNPSRSVETLSLAAEPVARVEVVSEPVQAASFEAAPVVEATMASGAAVAESAAGNNGPANIADSVVRVHVNLLDKIMNVVGELVLTRNQILQYANKNESPELARLSSQLNSITTELQSDIMTTRMQPIGSVLNRFERIVRDMARELGKKINLRIDGKDTELDKTLLEAIKDPLTHLVRNAVDHGMETIEERQAAKKSDEGNIHIKAYHEGGQVTIEIKDDGRGINRKRVLSKALEKGLLTQERAAKLGDKDIVNLVFLPGFSTAAKVTNISGRGVGMDVVKTNVERIGGQVDVISTEGSGSTFKLKIPLTLAIIPTLIVQDAGESFAIPQINLVELVRLEGDKLSVIEKVNGSEFFRLRGHLIPILRLNRVLKTRPNDEAIPKESENIVVLNAEGRVYGLVVDSILDTQEIVVKPLSKQLKAIGLYAGATIMGDGRVALILDALGLANQFHLEVEEEGELDPGAEMSEKNMDVQEVLLFKLQTKGVFGVPLTVVKRLEEFTKDQVEWTGSQAFIRYREQPMPLIRCDEALGFAAPGEELPDLIPVFVTSFGGNFYGFVVKEIMDINLTNFDLKSNPLDKAGTLGSLFIGDRTVSLIDIYWVAEKLGLTTKAKSEGKKTNGKKPVVLLAEDTPMFRKMAVSLLEGAGYEVILTVDGEEAYQTLLSRHKEIDIIVSDIEMPKMTGLEFAQAVRKHHEFDHIPMVALTTRFGPEDIRNGRAAGFNSYLEKFKKDEIITTCNEHLSVKVAG